MKFLSNNEINGISGSCQGVYTCVYDKEAVGTAVAGTGDNDENNQTFNYTLYKNDPFLATVCPLSSTTDDVDHRILGKYENTADKTVHISYRINKCTKLV